MALPSLEVSESRIPFLDGDLAGYVIQIIFIFISAPFDNPNPGTSGSRTILSLPRPNPTHFDAPVARAAAAPVHV
jgi:hypothetical protein